MGENKAPKKIYVEIRHPFGNEFTEMLGFEHRGNSDDIEYIRKDAFIEDMALDESKKEALAQEYANYTSKRHNIDSNSKEGQLIYYAYIHGINACLKELKEQKGE